MENYRKGTVTPLASAFPVEEAEKAAKRVEESVDTQRKELQKLEEFLQDNHNLMKLVQKLPDEISYNIMVPFGKAAFFPGRMIHTNELLVLLGEGYYAERTAKQTLEVLHRRTKVLESKIEGVKAFMDDLHAEASFFTSTASEAAAGVVEIREEYVEKFPLKEQPNSGKISSSAMAESDHAAIATVVDGRPSTEDKEYDHIMSRLTELEQAEADAEAEGNGSSSEEREETFNPDLTISTSEYGRVHDAEDDDNENNEVEWQPKISLEAGKGKSVMARSNMEPFNTMEPSTSKVFPGEELRHHATIRSPADFLKFEEQKKQPMEKEQASQPKVSVHKESIEPSTVGTLKAENYKRPYPAKTQAFKDAIGEHDYERKPDARRAFTGLVVEHDTTSTSNTVKGSDSSQAPDSKPSRPVSRFKMQKASR